MDDLRLETIPADRREAVRTALTETFGSSSAAVLDPVVGGASGASTHRVDAAGRSYLLRVEGSRSPLRNPHQYTCMRIAAESGVAPQVRYLDDDKGIVVTDFVSHRPLAEFPGGPPALAKALGALVARLQETPKFPALHDFPTVVGRLLAFVRSSGQFADGMLDPHAEGFERVREAYPWGAAKPVSSHNDPNPRNVLFDGERLLLVDWESAYRSDPLTDVAILAENLAPTPELESMLVRAWLGAEPDTALMARLRLMRLLTRLYYGGLLLTFARRDSRSGPETDLRALTPAEFGAAVAQGKLKPASSEAMWALGKACLAGFLAGLSAPGFEAAIEAAEAR
jgi:aminoglycoside phosphotransferase (APT) family kinase protein